MGKLKEIIDPSVLHQLTDETVIGIDIGSRGAKAVLLSQGNYYTAFGATGINMQETAHELLEELFAASGVSRNEVSYIVGTGYGRVALKFPDIPSQIVTEISCHALGAHFLNTNVKTILDIGGQDSKAIRVDPDSGKVAAFVMNDKCAAGTGRFLEKVAGLLELTIDDLGRESVKSQHPSEISSQCVVFAESEVISQRAKGDSVQDIAAGIHLASVRRVRSLLNRVGIEREVIFSGGVSNNIGMHHAVEQILGFPLVKVAIDAVYASALGAAIHAQQLFASERITESKGTSYHLDLTDLENRISAHHENLISSGDKIKKVGYLCTYTPLELINASGAAHLRLYKAGDTDVVASGEQITQSVFCDFTKSILGAFKEGDKLYNSLDKIYTFYTCDCIKKVGEAIGAFFKPSEVFNTPRLRHKDSSRDFYLSEILYFKEDLERLTGKEITEEQVSAQIKIYNKVRVLLKKISELRKRDNPPLTGKDFLDLIKGYYYLPAEDLVELYTQVYEKLSAAPDTGAKRIRLLMAGGIVADGDRRILELIEDEIGARIVAEDHCTGLKTIYHTISEEGNPFKALAHAYLDQAPCARMKPLQDRVDFSQSLAHEYQVDGVIYAYLKFCPCYGQIKNEFFRLFQNKDLPLLEIPVDYSKSDIGQIKTRVEAFVEVLKERKRQPAQQPPALEAAS
jgi:predicted CoA-substrate-specific enzyme activase